jgi:hypothetical protein
MKSVSRFVVVFAMLAIVSVAFGQDAEKKGKKAKGKGRQPQVVVAIQKNLDKAELSDEQKAGVAKLFATAKTELAELNKARTEIVGKNGKLAAEARKKAAAEGKKGDDVQQAIKAALGLDDEKFAKYTGIAKNNRELTQKLQADVAKLLTEEQRKATGIGVKKKRGGAKKKKTDN